MADAENIVVEVNAKTAAFIRDLAKAQKKTEDFVKKAEDGNKRLSKAFREAAASTAIIQGPLGPIAGRISSIGAAVGRVNPLVIGFGVAFAGLTLGLKEAVSVGAKYESQMFKLEALVKATGGASKLSASEINSFSKDLGEATLASAEGVRDAAGVLMTFRSISGETFKETLKLAQDLSAAGFGNLRTTTLSLGKALEDPIAGLTALRRQGIVFSSAQQDMIKSMVKAGDQMSAQRAILEEVNHQVGGAGVAAAKGLAGAWDTLGERWNRWLELASTSTGLLGSTATAVNWLSDSIKSLIAPMESAARIQSVMSEQIKPNIHLLKAFGIEADNIRTDSLIMFEADLRRITAAGIDLKANLPYAKLQKEILDATAAASAYEKKIQALKNAGVTVDAVFKNLNTSVEKQREKANAAMKALADLATTESAENIEAKKRAATAEQLALADKEAAKAVKENEKAIKGMYDELDKIIAKADPMGEAITKQTQIVQFFQSQLDSGAMSLSDFQAAMVAISEAGPVADVQVDDAKSSEKINKRFSRLQEGLLSERELLDLHYAKQAEIAGNYSQQEGADKEAALAALFDLDQKYHKDVQKLRDAEMKTGLRGYGQFFSSMMQLSAGSSKGLFGIAKAGAIATSIVQTYQAYTAALAGPPGPPWSYGIAAAALAKGLQSVNAIRSTSFGGGGGGGGAPSTPANAPSTPAPTSIAQPNIAAGVGAGTRVMVSIGEDDGLISKSAVRRLIESINEELKDGATLASIGVA